MSLETLRAQNRLIEECATKSSNICFEFMVRGSGFEVLGFRVEGSMFQLDFWCLVQGVRSGICSLGLVWRPF